MTETPRLGVILMISTMLVFAVQDGISRHLAETYSVWMVVMVRYWFFAAFVLTMAARSEGGIAQAARSARPGLQIFRGLLLAAEICVMVTAFVLIGLVESHAIFAAYPLIVAALSGPVLGEQVGWRRWTAIGIGFVGVLVILQPGFGVFKPAAPIAVCSAVLFALYALLTRYAARFDPPSVSFFYTGVAGAFVMTLVGVWFWEPMTGPDWIWMLALCITGAGGHWLLIKTYDIAEASAVQPFAYFQLVFASLIGVTLLGETIEPHVAIGAAIVIAAGVFTLLRARQA